MATDSNDGGSCEPRVPLHPPIRLFGRRELVSRAAAIAGMGVVALLATPVAASARHAGGRPTPRPPRPGTGTANLLVNSSFQADTIGSTITGWVLTR